MNFNRLVSEWAWRVNDGMPDPQNRTHLEFLKDVLRESGYAEDFISSYTQNLTEAGEDDKIVKYKDKEGNAKEMKADSAKKQAEDHPAKIAWLKTQDQDTDEKETKADPTRLTGSDFERKADKKSAEKDPKPSNTKSEFSAEEIAERLKSDKQSVQDSLMMTKTRAKEQAKEKGKKDVGLGTPESRAGEAMVHTGIQRLLEGASLEDIEEELTGLVNSDDHILNSKTGKQWVPATMASLRMLEKEVGVENIQNIAWDTDQGREAIGVDTKVETSSDAFIQLKDGTVVGVSLKKSGAVFLNSGGWGEQSKRIIDGLKDAGADKESIEKLEYAISTDRYKEHWQSSVDESLDAVSADDMKKAVENLTPEQKKKWFSNKQVYFDSLSDIDGLRERMKNGTASGNDKKAYSKLFQSSFPEEGKILRDVDRKMNNGLYTELKNNPEALSGIKSHIVKKMHISETLGLNETTKAGGVDKFTTIYGSGDEGAVLNEETLGDLLGDDFNDLLAKVRSGDASVDELNKLIEDKIELDLENRKVVFKHSSNKKYPLFSLHCRTKGLGGAPAMELQQTPLMAYALQQGTFDSDTWDEKAKKRFGIEMKDALNEIYEEQL